ncbi:hypothetical protein BJ085DRAFT_28259 [Dimargaris cristalligena]|uniref:Clavaminate synthase-like protein n=1 Tax=Dimargaris cristalligena TaxID=215637 RepID=A0A4P9ZS33_9FUNG|nr:hypothetical protein BJ085DRAFT_28259 [Dimargaris cristalligena]|eukprot:RKP35591.1 hypothetical protein BJ085DRAFT_28259 [Dimargaris cristalligena]
MSLIEASLGASKTPEGAVIIDFASLVGDDSTVPDLTAHIEEAFGEKDHCLGLVLVRNIPNLVAYRDALLDRTPGLAHLPAAEKDRLTDPGSRFLFGWSHGREMMNGKPDWRKGSFYANPVLDQPAALLSSSSSSSAAAAVVTDHALVEGYPEYYSGNSWPQEEHLPGFKEAFQELGQLIVQVGSLIAVHCDRYLAQKVPDYNPAFLQTLIKNSDTIKARLLHYFPESPPADANTTTTNKDPTETTPPASKDDSPDFDSWCGWHLDHSCLTGLTAAKFIDTRSLAESERLGEAEMQYTSKQLQTNLPAVACPDPQAGLYIKTRSNKVVRVRIPDDALAFQTGEALEIVSAGRLLATPHCVRGISPNCPTNEASGPPASSLSRNTFAVFIQPTVHDELCKGYTFAQFTKDVLNRHYH